MTRPRLLDLGCKAGGATRGYQQAGFYVVGVDIEPQPHYIGDEFVLGDMLQVGLSGYDAIHASPPCQQWTAYRRRGAGVGNGYPNLIPAIRERLQAAGVPYVIENIEPARAELRDPVMLCGTGFGLDVQRHRLFESNEWLFGVPCVHGLNAPQYQQATNRQNPRRTVEVGVWRIPLSVQRRAMGIDWMTLKELSEAIPPVYMQHVGEQLLARLGREAATAASGP